MTIPKHSDDIREDRQAVAPYNFVPLPDEIRLIQDPPSQGFYDENLLTGKISCKLTNSTPIYVRAAQSIEEFEKKQVSHEPFYYGTPKEKLLIPGSSIRGMLRTLVEVVSQARISPVTDKQLFYRSVEDTSMGDAYRDRMKDKVRAGIFHHSQSGDWIVPTIAARVTRADIRKLFGVNDIYEELDSNNRPIKASSPKRVPKKKLQHQTVYVQLDEAARENPTRFFTVKQISTQRADGLEEALLVITGDMKVKPAKNGEQREKKEFVFLKMAIESKIPLTDEQVDLFEDKDQLTQYQGYAFPKTTGRKGDGKLKDGDPVFYLVGDDERKVIGFGRAYMFRLPYELSPAQMLPESLADEQDHYDLAEALFGYVPQIKKGRKQVAGRVSITDAVMQGDIGSALFPETRLKILSSPKATAFQHYLTQEKPDDPDKLSHYDTTTEKTTLRGHKFYWHKGPVKQSDFEANEQGFREHDSQYSPPVKPIRENQIFEFEICFENLRPEELGALLWVLDKAGDERFRLKLGMGKPYGLGSVAIVAKPEIENRIQRYQKLFSDRTWFILPDKESGKKSDDARSAFARWLLKKQDVTPANVDELPRIQELLIMLSWLEHPKASKTRYMELDEFAGRKHMLTGQRGYFPKRPVLPGPHVVFGKWLKQPASKTNESGMSKNMRDDSSSSQRVLPPGYEHGTVKEFGLGPKQSFGFITRSNGADLFVHRNALSSGLTTLKTGQKVIFKVGKGSNGPQAQDVRLDE